MKNFLLLFLVLALSGCATGSLIVTGTERPPVPVSTVKIFDAENPPPHYEVIGLVSCQGDTRNVALSNIKSKASRAGANAIIIERFSHDMSGNFIDGKAVYVKSIDPKPAQ